MIKLVVYVPEGFEESVKEALFKAGAGRSERYDRCCWETKGTGQFRPLGGSNPFLGSLDTVERVTETRIEMLVTDELASAAEAALIRAHPYEEPAYEFHSVTTRWVQNRK